MKRPFDEIVDSIYDLVQRTRENSKFIFQHSDKLLVWIIGFSVTGITLIISNFNGFNENFSTSTTQWVLNLLATCVVSGIIFRIAYFYHMIVAMNIEVYLETALSDKRTMLMSGEKIEANIDYYSLIDRFKSDFNKDMTYLLEVYNSSNETQKLILYQSLKDYYNDTSSWAKKDAENGLEFIKDTFHKAYGIGRNRLDKMFASNSNSIAFRVTSWISFTTFLTSTIAFIIVIILLIWSQ